MGAANGAQQAHPSDPGRGHHQIHPCCSGKTLKAGPVLPKTQSYMLHSVHAHARQNTGGWLDSMWWLFSKQIPFNSPIGGVW